MVASQCGSNKQFFNFFFLLSPFLFASQASSRSLFVSHHPLGPLSLCLGLTVSAGHQSSSQYRANVICTHPNKVVSRFRTVSPNGSAKGGQVPGTRPDQTRAVGHQQQSPKLNNPQYNNNFSPTRVAPRILLLLRLLF